MAGIEPLSTGTQKSVALEQALEGVFWDKITTMVSHDPTKKR